VFTCYFFYEIVFFLRNVRNADHYFQVVAASELALSVLPHAGALNPNEIQRAIQQCKEQSNTMLEKACLAVEKAATGGGVYPEVMFEVARHWYHLFEKHAPTGPSDGAEEEHQAQHDHVSNYILVSKSIEDFVCKAILNGSKLKPLITIN
jgi:hypothetical protein